MRGDLSRDLVRQTPVQAADRADLREKLSAGSGGVVITTIQKFFPDEKGNRQPVLSKNNIVVIADEAHRGPVRLHRRLRARHVGRAPERIRCRPLSAPILTPW